MFISTFSFKTLFFVYCIKILVKQIWFFIKKRKNIFSKIQLTKKKHL